MQRPKQMNSVHTTSVEVRAMLLELLTAAITPYDTAQVLLTRYAEETCRLAMTP